MTALATRNRLVPVSNPRILALVTDSATEATARMAAAELGLGDVAVEGADLAAAAERMRSRASPSVLIVDMDGARGAPEPSDPLSGLNQLAEVCDPGVKVVAVGSRNDVAFYRSLLQAGVADYLVKPVTPADIVRAVREGAGIGGAASAVPRSEAVNEQPRRLVAVVGTRGGVGTTTVAVNLALALAGKDEKPAALLDLDLRFGTSALAFDIEPGSGLKELLADPTRIDPLLIERAAVKVTDKLVLLAAEEALDASVPVTSGVVPLIDAMTRGGDWVVADVPRDVLLREKECLVNATAVVIITDFSLVSLREVIRLRDWLSTASRAELLVVSNASRPKVEGDLAPAEFARSSGVTIVASVPFDLKGVAATARKSKPMMIAAPQSAAARVLRTVADRIAPAPAQKGIGRVFTFRSLLPSGRSKASPPQAAGGRA